MVFGILVLESFYNTDFFTVNYQKNPSQLNFPLNSFFQRCFHKLLWRSRFGLDCNPFSWCMKNVILSNTKLNVGSELISKNWLWIFEWWLWLLWMRRSMNVMMVMAMSHGLKYNNKLIFLFLDFASSIKERAKKAWRLYYIRLDSNFLKKILLEYR